MKKFFFLLSVILFLTSCTGSSESASSESVSTESNYLEEDNNESIKLSSEIESGGSNLTQASIIAHDFVKEHFANDCDFDDLDIRGESVDMVPGRFKVLQKFKSKKFGSQQEYVYKIFIQYYGGEWEDKNNWDFGQLTIENTTTGEQFVYNGTMKQRDQKPTTLGTKTIAGVEFKETQKKNVVIYSTPQQLSYKTLKAVVQELKGSPKDIQFFVDSEIENGEDYASLIGNTFIYIPSNKLESLK
jgi:hypothetical protein